MATGRPGGRGGGSARGPSRPLRAVRRPEASAPVATDAPGPDEAEVAARARTRVAERAEAFLVEDELLAGLRARSAEAGVVAVSPATAAALTFLAASTRARAVVEIGTGLGIGTVALLRGMPADGLLTSIDPDGERQGRARAACAEAGFPPGRVRMIKGTSRQVLPKLSDAGYDLVVVDGVTTEMPRDLEASLRLLRPGGVVVVDDVLWAGRLADPVRREAVAGALRETVRVVREDERLVPLVLPIADGLLCAALREPSGA
ncbi:putative O-methyltransferase YrrM [Actinomycetospora succinea]|uniref:Putative O-methyltransferase YrrM n=1 Tax=Actinomycetospora succinea TaxID=663603 RepID=A0A4R6VCP6_9PSEU|nr:class I SAM-dependent methyltransferase [Actinomycetospora succinea]TDQ58464.1 putative O-methyltransferase YrrM [Actinomycetospora succinea]